MSKDKAITSAISKQYYKRQQGWGLIALINLYECDNKIIIDPDKIKVFTIKLCEMIDMKRYGEPRLARFGQGELEGWSLMQFIETSSITAHFDETEARAFIDIFSCRYFDSKAAARFCKNYFKANNFSIKCIIRK
jgi:S-adenosylmethionine decarboxylase